MGSDSLLISKNPRWLKVSKFLANTEKPSQRKLKQPKIIDKGFRANLLQVRDKESRQHDEYLRD